MRERGTILFMLTPIFHRERAFLSELSHKERGLIGGSFFYALAVPILTVFSNTYLLRQSPEPITLALFNIGFFLGLPIGFYINGTLLKKFASARLYFAGCVLQGLVPMMLVALGARASTFALVLGLALGLSGGLYWGNRNFLTSRHTAGLKRFKFLSVEMTGATTAGIFFPIIIGAFLTLGERTGWYAVQSAYEIAAGFAMLSLVTAGACVVRNIRERDTLSTLAIRRPGYDWNRLRVIEVLHGAVHGFEAVIPIVILLLFVGLEDSIGAVKSYTAVLAALSLYVVGRRLKHKHHASVLGIWTVLTAIGRGLFALFHSLGGALAMFTADGLAGSWRWASASAVMYETVEKEAKGVDGGARYAYIADRELFLNIGRVASLVLFIMLFRSFPEPTIRYGLLLPILAQIPIVLLTKKQTACLPHVS